MTTGPWRVDHTSLTLAALLAAHPVSLADCDCPTYPGYTIHDRECPNWGGRMKPITRDQWFDVGTVGGCAEDDEDSQRGDMADWESARRYGR